MSDLSDEDNFDGAGKFIKIAPFNSMDIDLTKPPVNGEEFLQRVILEKRTTKSKSIKLERVNLSNLNQMAMDVSNEPSVDTSKFPSPEWCSEQIQVFSELRMKAEKTKLEILQGKLKVELMDSKLFHDEDYCQQFISSQQPTQTIITKLNQVALDSLLESLSDSLISERVSICQLGRWIYAVMVYLETPLVPEMHHSLRTIAKYCRTTREQTDIANVERLGALNLFITIISKYFGQSDLGDRMA